MASKRAMAQLSPYSLSGCECFCGLWQFLSHVASRGSVHTKSSLHLENLTEQLLPTCSTLEQLSYLGLMTFTFAGTAHAFSTEAWKEAGSQHLKSPAKLQSDISANPGASVWVGQEVTERPQETGSVPGCEEVREEHIYFLVQGCSSSAGLQEQDWRPIGPKSLRPSM